MRIETAESDSTYDWRHDGWLAACALTAFLLVVSAATPHAPGFDTFLRAFVFCLALVRGFAGFRSGGAWLPLSAALIAILFNPVQPIAMTSSGWIWCDLIAAAWFAIVGAWRLLRSWEPQRGWAVAAVSLSALAVPAVAALSAPNRDTLKGMNLDENSNANAASATSPASAENPSGAAPVVLTKPVEEASAAPSARHAGSSAANASANEVADRQKPDEREISAAAATQAPPLANRAKASSANAPANAAPADVEPLNNESDGNQE